MVQLNGTLRELGLLIKGAPSKVEGAVAEVPREFRLARHVLHHSKLKGTNKEEDLDETYKETCEVLLDDPKTGGENIKDFVKKSIRNLLRANIDLHSRRLIADFPGYGVKCIENFSHIVQT